MVHLIATIQIPLNKLFQVFQHTFIAQILLVKFVKLQTNIGK
jgi:hypothetical protein